MSYKYCGFSSQTPEQLATAGASRNRREKERDEQELIRVAEMEKAVKKAQVLKLSARSVVYTVYYTLSIDTFNHTFNFNSYDMAASKT